MAIRVPRLADLMRGAVLVLLAALLLARLGPFCEASAQAARIVTARSGCDGKETPATEKKGGSTACASPCMAVPSPAQT